jgi:NADH-quinone oxidoreductase subunit C
VATPVTERLLEAFEGVVRGVNSSCDEATVMVVKDHLMEVLNFLKMDPDCSMNYLSDLTAAHYPNNDKPFQVVYQCYSIDKGQSLRIKVELDEGETCPSAVEVWPAANWLEREAHDMFGIVFEGHPDLKVILLPEGWQGHPLRKDYPLGGPKEEAIRADKFAKPAYLPDDLEEGLRIIAQHIEEDGSGQ